MRHILLVDDDYMVRDCLAAALREVGSYRVTPAADAQIGQNILRVDRPDGLIVDAVLPRVSGLVLARSALQIGVPVLLISGEPRTQEELRTAGCQFLAKPFRIPELIEATKRLVEQGIELQAQVQQQLERLARNSADLSLARQQARESVRASQAARARRGYKSE